MSLEIAIQQNTAAINTLIEILSKGVYPTLAPAEAITMPDPAPAKKAKPAKQEAAPAEAPKAEAPAADPAPAETVAAPTYDETAKPLVAVGAKFGRAKVMEILNPFGGATSLKQVDPSDYAKVMAACKAVLG